MKTLRALGLVALAIPTLADKPKFSLTSDNFKPGGNFPVESRGDEDNVSPHLKWAGAPEGTQAFALVMDHAPEGKDARDTAWVVYDIPSSVTELREELAGSGASDVPRLGMKDEAGQEPVVVDPMESMMGGMGGYEDPEIANMRSMISGMVDSGFDPAHRAKEGKTSSGAASYAGPESKGRVSFKLYALNGRLSLPPGASKQEVVAAMKGKVLGKATLEATIP